MNQNQNDQKQNKIRYRVCVFLAGSFLVHWQKQTKKGTVPFFNLEEAGMVSSRFRKKKKENITPTKMKRNEQNWRTASLSLSVSRPLPGSCTILGLLDKPTGLYHF